MKILILLILPGLILAEDFICKEDPEEKCSPVFATGLRSLKKILSESHICCGEDTLYANVVLEKPDEPTVDYVAGLTYDALMEGVAKGSIARDPACNILKSMMDVVPGIKLYVDGYTSISPNFYKLSKELDLGHK